MVFYINSKLENWLKTNNYFEIYKLLANFSVGIGAVDEIVNYKRIHVNDAIRFFAEEILNFDKKKKDFDHYSRYLSTNDLTIKQRCIPS